MTKQISHVNTPASRTYVDLFAGAGGFSLGFLQAGFECIGAVEVDARAAMTYVENFPEHANQPFTCLGPERGNILNLNREFFVRTAEDYGISDIDVLIGGPPCQGFSKVGRGKLDSLAKKNGSFKSDPRNRLYLKFVETLVALKPKAFLFENVGGLLHLKGANFAETICRDASESGYSVLCTVLNSAWFGVPQTRERVFVLGIRSDLPIKPSFPKPTNRADLSRGHLTGVELSESLFTERSFFIRTRNPESGPPAISVEEAIGDLPAFTDHLTNSNYRAIRHLFKPQTYRQGRPNSYASTMRNWSEKLTSGHVTDHFCRHTPRDYEIFGAMKSGDKYPRAVEIAESLYGRAKELYTAGYLAKRPIRKDFVPPYSTDSFAEKWRKLIPDQPSWTITAHLGRDTYSHIHYDSKQKRMISIREAARLQSFPDAFCFQGNMGDCFRQIGNAVPPLLAYELAEHINLLLAEAEHRERTVSREKSFSYAAQV
jgi:DNA (cytosine-5)-methyltransferase 1